MLTWRVQMSCRYNFLRNFACRSNVCFWKLLKNCITLPNHVRSVWALTIPEDQDYLTNANPKVERKFKPLSSNDDLNPDDNSSKAQHERSNIACINQNNLWFVSAKTFSCSQNLKERRIFVDKNGVKVCADEKDFLSDIRKLFNFCFV